MTTMSPSKARNNFTAWLKKAAAGEEIGIRFGGKVYVLHPVDEDDTSYAEREYGVTKKELARFAKKLHAQGEKDRKTGKSRVYNGNIEDLIKG
jgi:antitoxin (DNA-binding transcriptional repressor) of toxin-antitoxin stability system